MIPDIVIGWILDLVDWFISYMPTWSIDLSGLNSIAGYLNWVGAWVDLGAWAAVAGVMLAIEFGVWSFSALRWLWDRLPFT